MYIYKIQDTNERTNGRGNGNICQATHTHPIRTASNRQGRRKDTVDRHAGNAGEPLQPPPAGEVAELLRKCVMRILCFCLFCRTGLSGGADGAGYVIVPLLPKCFLPPQLPLYLLPGQLYNESPVLGFLFVT